MHRIGWAGWLPVFLAVPCIAESRVVTEAEFLSVLDASHPAVIESAEAWELSKAKTLEVSTFDDPVVGVVREDPNGPVAQTDLTVSWQLPGADRRLLISSRREATEAESARLAQRLLSLRLIMKEDFADWALASERRQHLEDNLARIEALADRERLRVERGETSGLEVRRLDLMASGWRLRIAQAEAKVQRAWRRAASWSPDLPADAHPVLPSVPEAVARELVESDTEHPLARAAAGDLTAATLERQAAGRFVRSPEISLGWHRQESASQSIDGPLIGLTWSLPIFDRKRAAKAASDARVTAARARQERVEREIDVARAASLEAFQTLRTAFQESEESAEDGERMLDGIEVAFQHGEASLTDLLDIYRSVTEAEHDRLELYEAVLAAHRDLERAIGATPNPTLPNPREQHPPQESLP